MVRNLIVSALVAIIMAGFVLAYVALQPSQAQPPMGGPVAQGLVVPPVKGFAEGQEVRFIHTEASDSQVADMLVKMMDSPVLMVPSLSRAPEEMLADVYVFTNGIEGEGPFGFQPDVFDSPPGDPGYSPLRGVNSMAWNGAASPQLLKSAAEVKKLEERGEVTITGTGIVVNMPFLTWPGGRR